MKGILMMVMMLAMIPVEVVRRLFGKGPGKY